MKKILPIVVIALIAIIIIKAISGGSDLNSIPDPHFTVDGSLSKQPDTAKTDRNSVVRFYVESSGSMNGFFRNGRPTAFKRDVYSIMSYYSDITKDINIMTNNGSVAGKMTLANFQSAMNIGALQSNASTQVPVMLSTIISQLKKGEVAVLISDMKYSPVGSLAPDVLLTQYGADVARIAGASGKAFSLICATSNYVDKSGEDVTKRSPYYYLLIGDQDKLSYIRNGISSLLEKGKTYVDNLDFGYHYGSIPYSFGIPKNAIQYNNQPTFYGYDESLGACTITLKLHLAAYRWLVAEKEVVQKYFTVKSLYGSKVKITGVDIQANNFTNQKLERSAIATIKLSVNNMPTEMDVLEWNLKIPDATEAAYIGSFLGGKSENDVTKSYSIDNFIVGIQQGGVVNKQPDPNFILITKNNI